MSLRSYEKTAHDGGDHEQGWCRPEVPLAFELKKFVVVLQPQKLSEEEQKRLQEQLAKAMMAVQ